ncbi:MAG: Ig family protein [Nocardioides sp.]|nr:Ig family protein [Nocardioides sp.]
MDISRESARLALALAVVAGGGAAASVGAGSAYAAPVNSCWSTDNAKPSLAAVSFSPATVDVSDDEARVTVTADVRDAGGPGPATGVSYVYGWFDAPSDTAHFTLRRTDGGTWEGEMVIPEGSAAGSYSVASLSLADGADNARTYESSDLDQVAGADQELVVTSSVPPDTTPPRLDELSLDRLAVDTTSGVRSIGVSARATDDESGLAGIHVEAHALGRNASLVPPVDVELTRADDGTFGGELRIPRWVGTHSWSIAVQTTDQTGNFHVYRLREETSDDLDGTFEVTSGTDRKPPRVSHIRHSPSKVDVRQHGRNVTVTARVRDATSGVRVVRARLRLVSSSSGVRLRRASGTSHDGVWTGTVRVPRCFTLAGPQHVAVSASDLAGLGADNRHGVVRVRASDTSAPRAHIVHRRAVPAAGPVLVRFPEPVQGIAPHSVDVESDAAGPTPVRVAGTWSCLDGSQRVTGCRTGRVRVARFTPDQPMAAESSYRFVPAPDGKLAVTDLAGNPVTRSRGFATAG